MPIQFACPSCARGYSVKDELAGKNAKCGQCGHKMSIPAATAKASAAAKSLASAAKSPSAKVQSTSASSASSPSSSPSSASSMPSIKSPTKLAPLSASAAPAVKPKPAKSVTDPSTSSWLDEELETARVEAKSKPKPQSAEAGCPSCNGPLAPGAVICVKCGYDTRIRGKGSVERVVDDDSTKKRSKLRGAASLLRGTFFSFLGAMVGAFIWAILAYLTMYEFSIVAWGLGGLAGLGMAFGHESDDGTFPGIIAAGMSFVGIVAAKIFIVVIVVAAAISSAVNDLELADLANSDPLEMQRTALASAMTMKDLANMEESGNDEADRAIVEAAFAKNKAEVAVLTAEELEARISELGAEHGLEGNVEDFGDDSAEHEEALDGADAGEVEDDNLAADESNADDIDEDVSAGSLIGSLFRPIDGLFILLAFFTAYKAGSGEATD